jgi:hypothetical protein
LKPSWCVVRLGSDLNWWVHEVSDPIHWDIDGLSILDPKQVAYIIELVDGFKSYGFSVEVFKDAFSPFRIERKMAGQLLRLTSTPEDLLAPEEPLFALPDVINGDKGPYADFIAHITHLKIKMLNDTVAFENKFSVDELEEELRDRYQQEFFEGRSIHVFKEITDILEYAPDGYSTEVEGEEENPEDEEELYEDFGIDDNGGGEEGSLEEDDTMHWDDEAPETHVEEIQTGKEKKKVDKSHKKKDRKP